MINDQREERQVWDVQLFYPKLQHFISFFVFCFSSSFIVFFWAEIRKKGVKKECLRFSCKINEQVYVERFKTTFILNVQFFCKTRHDYFFHHNHEQLTMTTFSLGKRIEKHIDFILNCLFSIKMNDLRQLDYEIYDRAKDFK